MRFSAAVDGPIGRANRGLPICTLLLLAAGCGGTSANKADSATTDTAPADQASMMVTDSAPQSDAGVTADATSTDGAPIPVDTGAATDVAPSMDTASADTATSPDTSPPDAAVGKDINNPNDTTSADITTLTDGSARDATITSDAPLAASSLAVRFADSIITRWPDPGNIGGKPYGWDYNIGIVLTGMQKVYERTGDAKYLTYIRKYVDAHVDAAGSVDIPASTAHSLDLIQPSGLLLFLFQQTGASKYSAAAQVMRTRFDTFPKNPDGGFWHKQTYPNEMWLDGIYMAEPFLVRYGRQFSSCGAFCNDTAVAQTTLLSGHVLAASSGLLAHGWDQDKNAAWANATTGNSPEVWGRASGWFAMALVDMLNDLPTSHAGHAQFLSLLTKVAEGMRATQDSASGLWFQVLDKGTRSDNWLETSGSGMFVYALKVAVDRGYLDASFLAVAQKGYAGLRAKVTTDSAGLPVINEAVQGMSVQVDYASYVAQMRLSNSVHGLCAILMAASQMD